MSFAEEPPREGGEPVPDDPFLADDPAASERERRRREREARRRDRQARTSGALPPAPEGPGARERLTGALGGLSARANAVRRERARRRQERQATESPAPRNPAPNAGEPALAAREPAHAADAGGRGFALRVPRSPLFWAAAIGLIVIAWFLVSLFQPFKGAGEGRVVVQVPRGATAGEIADLLAEEEVVASSTFFELRLTLAGRRSDVLAGTYTLARDMPYSDAIDTLTTPPSERTITVTVPEGYSREQTAALVTESGLDGSFEQASESSRGFDPARYGGDGAENLEGFLYPATYELKPGASAEDLVADQLEAFEQNFSDVDLGYAKSKNLTPYDVLIIASMIEEEVMVPEERKLVAAVIYNRLADGEPLFIDATIRYATGNYTEPLTESELAIDSPYNTRTNAGLPPGPIGNPGIESIEAAANPSDADYRYYVVKPGTCGEHVFSTTQAEHDAAVARYEEAREAAGGKSPDDCPEE
jgi:UPF0755 protein